MSQDADVVSYQDYPYSYDMDASYAVQEAVDQYYDYDTEASYDQLAEQTYYDGDYVPETAPVAVESFDLADEGPWNYHYDSDYGYGAVEEHVIDHSYDEVADVSHVDEA